jgi:TPP-dependent indolepyruvate ferredoxin oxidoreductase alpha subunit
VAPGAYDLSGPQALTFAEAASVLAERTGRPVAHVDLPVEQWVAGAAANGLPVEYAGMLGGLFGLIRDGHDAHVSDGVQRALGRPATSFADWAAREVHPAARDTPGRRARLCQAATSTRSAASARSRSRAAAVVCSTCSGRGP